MREPDWTAAARALLSGCLDLPDGEQRLALLEQVCRGLGDRLYPDFLHLLAMIGERGDAQACGALAMTLLEGLRSGRLPSGRRQAWGAAGGTGLGAGGFGARRMLGPLEYLCASQDGAGADLATDDEFLRQGQALLRLIDGSEAARQLYVQRLRALAADPVEGGLSRTARQALDRLAGDWEQRLAPDAICQRYLNALRDGRGSGLASLAQLRR